MPEDDTKKGPDVEDEENEGTDEDVLDQGKADEDKTKTKLDNLDGALEEETRKVAEKEDELRRLREKRRTINETINREATETETSDEEAEGDDTEGKVVTTKLRDQIKHELRVEQQRDNFDSAKRKFYKTVIGKRYDPLNDPEGRLWKSLEDYLHLTDRDVAEERIIQKLVAAALGHQQDKYVGADEEYRRNVEIARGALDDRGTGPLLSGRRRGTEDEAATMTDEEKKVASRMGITAQQFIAARKKLSV